jgi:hypothetical protein
MRSRDFDSSFETWRKIGIPLLVPRLQVQGLQGAAAIAQKGKGMKRALLRLYSYSPSLFSNLAHPTIPFFGTYRLTRTEPASTEPERELWSRVFPARCRHCHWEVIYTLGQIVEFPIEESNCR